MIPQAVLQRALMEREVVAVLGPGGVGKTTLAASMALAASSAGRRTLVVTIDPAKRLATALGLELGHEVSHVQDNLDAVMVDTKRALDEMLIQYAPSREKLDAIFASPLYQQFSSALVGSEEFAAMGLLHEYYTRQDYDLIVVDTPPSKHALDFLTVNQRLIRVFQSGLTKWLFKPAGLFSVAGGRMAKVVARWTSREFLDTVSDFMLHFEEMFYEMEDRVETMEALLQDHQRTALGLVAVPDPGGISEAMGLVEGLSEIGLQPSFSIANRVYPPLGADSLEGDERALLDHYARLARVHMDGIARMREQAGPVVIVPALPKLEGLAGLGTVLDYLVPGTGPPG